MKTIEQSTLDQIAAELSAKVSPFRVAQRYGVVLTVSGDHCYLEVKDVATGNVGVIRIAVYYGKTRERMMRA